MHQASLTEFSNACKVSIKKLEVEDASSWPNRKIVVERRIFVAFETSDVPGLNTCTTQEEKANCYGRKGWGVDGILGKYTVSISLQLT